MLQNSSAVSSEDRAYIASKMYAAIALYFAHFQAIPEFDLETRYQEFLKAAFAAPGRFEFDLACLEFFAQLKNGHSAFRDVWLREQHGQPFGFDAQYMEQSWVVTASDISGLSRGDVLEAIDGHAIEELYQKNKRYIAESNERGTRTRFFSHRHLFPQEFVLETKEGIVLPVKRQMIPILTPQTTGKWLRSNQVAYIKIPSFLRSRPYEQDALRLVHEFKDAPALIIDLRGNGGGTTPRELIDALMDRPYRSSGQATPLHVGVWKVWGGFFDEINQSKNPPRDAYYGYMEAMKDLSHQGMFFQPGLPVKPQNPTFKGKVIILIDRFVFSAAEDFCIPFKDNRRALFIGETSCGSTGQPYGFTFPNGMRFQVSTKRDCFPDGSPFEGVGIIPDIDLPMTITDLRSDTDQMLEKALSLTL